MKTLSLTQPWATLVMTGDKRIETRSWGTSYRGELAIHAAKGFPRWAIELCSEEPFKGALLRAGIRAPEDLPRGAVLGIVHLHAVGAITERADGAVLVRTQELPVTGEEQAFGDYTPGRYGWRFSRVIERFPAPVPARGSLGLWEWQP